MKSIHKPFEMQLVELEIPDDDSGTTVPDDATCRVKSLFLLLILNEPLYYYYLNGFTYRVQYT